LLQPHCLGVVGEVIDVKWPGYEIVDELEVSNNGPDEERNVFTEG